MSNTILEHHPEYTPKAGQENLRNAFPFFWPCDKVKKFVVRISIDDVTPSIFRDYVVPSNVTMRHFAHFTFDILGWIGFRLHWFVDGNKWYAPYFSIESRKITPPADSILLPQEDYAISDILTTPGQSICFNYDCGYIWKHHLELLSIEDYAQGEPAFAVLDGARDCPPEMCGGKEGYDRLVDINARMEAGLPVSRKEKRFFDDCYYGNEGDWGPETFEVDFYDDICLQYSNGI